MKSKTLRDFLGTAPLLQCTKCGKTLSRTNTDHQCFVEDADKFQEQMLKEAPNDQKQ